MNDQQLAKKLQNDIADIRRDLNSVMENSVSNVSKGFEKLKNDTKKTLSGAAESVKKDVENGLDQYNAKAQEYADKTLGGFGGFVRKYPWVVITAGLGIGIFLGGLLKPSHRF